MLALDFQNRIDNLLKYKFDQLTGGMDFMNSSELKTEFDYCFEILGTKSSRADLIDYVESCMPFLKSEIKRKKTIIKSFKNDFNSSLKVGHTDMLEIMKSNLKVSENWIHIKREELNEELIKREDLAIDLSDSSLTEKIIYLEKLGILDFLRKKEPFDMSVNRLADVLSAITGSKSSTIQSYLNPIYSDSAIQKNNPLNKEKPVEKIKQKLISLGYNLSN